jgi:hypothetical protein
MLITALTTPKRPNADLTTITTIIHLMTPIIMTKIGITITITPISITMRIWRITITGSITQIEV